MIQNLYIQDDEYELELSDIAQNQLLLKALPHLFFSNPKIEIFLNKLRYYPLPLFLDEGSIGKDHLVFPLFEPMAQRAFNNEIAPNGCTEYALGKRVIMLDPND